MVNMTPTTSEREARELLAREYEREGHSMDAEALRHGLTGHHGKAIRAIIAALTREQREGDECPHEAWEENGGARICADCRKYLGSAEQPQQEAPGAVAWRSWMDEDRALKPAWSGWSTDASFLCLWKSLGRRIEFAYPPAPVRTLRELADAMVPDHSDEEETEFDRGYDQAMGECRQWVLALLDGQPAGVDRG